MLVKVVVSNVHSNYHWIPYRRHSSLFSACYISYEFLLPNMPRWIRLRSQFPILCKCLNVFRGHLVRYVYKLTLGVQHVKSPVKLIHVPLRIIQADLGLALPSSPTLMNPFISSCSIGYLVKLRHDLVLCYSSGCEMDYPCNFWFKFSCSRCSSLKVFAWLITCN